jgi:hypothetical protein
MEFGLVGSWVVVGLVVGWLAGFVMKGRGYGLIWDMGSVSSGASGEAGSSAPWASPRAGSCSRRCSSPAPGRPS